MNVVNCIESTNTKIGVSAKSDTLLHSGMMAARRTALNGRPKTKNPRTKQIGLSVTPGEHQIIKRLAGKRGWTSSDWIRAMLVVAAIAVREPGNMARIAADYKEDLEVFHRVMERASTGDVRPDVARVLRA